MIKHVISLEEEGPGVIELELMQDNRVWIDCHAKENGDIYCPILLDRKRLRVLQLQINSIFEAMDKNDKDSQ
jgi:hypothetical protein